MVWHAYACMAGLYNLLWPPQAMKFVPCPYHMGLEGHSPQLVDRHMDLLTPALHQDHVLDCIFGQLAARTTAPLSAAANGHKPVHGRTADSNLAEAADTEEAANNTRAMVSAARGENTATIPLDDAPDASNAGSIELGDEADESSSLAPSVEQLSRPRQQQQQSKIWQPYNLR